ncbi:MAG: YfhO family protein, partial [Oscillospiraceae bacterium]
KWLGYSSREHYSRYDGATVLTDDIFGVKYVLAKDSRTVPYTETVDRAAASGIRAYVNPDALGFAYLADKSVLELTVDDYIVHENPTDDDGEKILETEQPFLLQNELAKSLAGEGQQDIFLPLTDIEFDCHNIRTGSTTDAHFSYRKRDEDSDGWISYTVKAEGDGAVYMYLPTAYERECDLYINDAHRGTYFLYENYSIEYLGTYKEGDTFDVRLELRENAVYFKEAQFYYADGDALSSFTAAMSRINPATSPERTSGDSMKLDVVAENDCVLFTTIPMEEGWSAYVDGEQVPLQTTMNGSLIALSVPKGQHTITLDFFPAGLKTGLLFTASGILLLIIMMLSARLMEKQGLTAEAEELRSDEDGRQE